MSDAEKQVLKVLAHYMIDQVEQPLIDAELAKISNPAVLAAVKAIESALMPVILKAEDAKVDAL